MGTLKLWAGASGYAFKEWKGSFYPEKIQPDAMLAWYAERLPAVEINNTVYQRPKVAVLEHWARVWQLPRVTAYSIVAMLAYGSQALVFAWFCDAVGTGIPAAACVLIFVQATLFGAASMSPGGLGAMEAALVIQLTERSVEGSVAVSIAIAIRLVTLWLGMAIGAICLLVSSRRTSAQL